jgi:hypothetical protein
MTTLTRFCAARGRPSLAQLRNHAEDAFPVTQKLLHKVKPAILITEIVDGDIGASEESSCYRFPPEVCLVLLDKGNDPNGIKAFSPKNARHTRLTRRDICSFKRGITIEAASTASSNQNLRRQPLCDQSTTGQYGNNLSKQDGTSPLSTTRARQSLPPDHPAAQ